MRGAVTGLLTFDSRLWLGEIGAPTLVVGGTHDEAVPWHHYDALVSGIPGATGRLAIVPVTHSSGAIPGSSPISSEPSDHDQATYGERDEIEFTKARPPARP